jgi:signal transduction histidine kinase
MIRKSKSLTFRILLLSSIWIALALIVTGLMLLTFYRAHIEEHYDAHVRMHMEELVSAAQLSEAGELLLAYPPSDPRYQVKYSGWYWEIRHQGKVLAGSPSLDGGQIRLGQVESAEYEDTIVVEGPDGEAIRVQMLQNPAGIPGETLLLVGSAPMMGVTDDVIDVTGHLLLSFALLGLGLLFAVFLQVRVTLKPVHDISQGIHHIHRGKSERVDGEFPNDIQPLVDELNNILEHNSVLLRRARNQVGDLAHSIKNPLTVINHEARAMDNNAGRLILKQAADISNSVSHHLSRARAFGTANVMGSSTQVRPVAEDLVFALKRIYKDRNLDFDLSGICNCAVRCEAQDLEEMLGNLMDNACKWAKKRVIIHCVGQGNRCSLYVEDDGSGIPDDKISQVLQRGRRLDETREGDGLGLNIVQELVGLYSGSLYLGRSGWGGLSVQMDLPS